MTENQGLTLQFVGLLILASIWVYFKAINEWRRYQSQRQSPLAVPPRQVQNQRPYSHPQQQPAFPIKGAVLPGAGRAMIAPPTDLRVAIQYIKREFPDLHYAAPLGWYIYPTGQADCVAVGFIDDTYHMLITGMSRAGKDNLVLNMMFALTRNHRPSQLQVCFIDGKGLDFAGWEGKAHTWRLALKPQEIKPTMEALSKERERRADILRAAGVTKWENYKGDDLPLLIVYISELSLLQDATTKSELTNWMNSELAAGAAFGLRYIVATQTASNFDTRWRAQISVYVAAFQPRDDQDEANTGLTSKLILAGGGVPPSSLPPPPEGAGVFTVVHGRKCQTIRATYLDDDQRNAWLSCLPNAAPAILHEKFALPLAEAKELEELVLMPGPAAGQPEISSSTTALAPAALPEDATPSIEQIESSGAGLNTTAVEVPESERNKILEAATRLPSRRQVCQELYGSTGGTNYEYVRAVLAEYEKLPISSPASVTPKQTLAA